MTRGATPEIPSPLTGIDAAGAPTVRRPVIFFWLAIFAALAFTGRLCEVYRPFSSDAAMFIYMGKLVSQGGRVGLEMIDNKFPTVGLMTSGAWRLFGGNWPAYVLLETAMVALAITLLARSARRNLGPGAVLPFVLFALVFLNFRFAVDGGFQLESIQMFFEMVAAASVLSSLMADDARDSFVVGLAAGMAALLKPSGLAVLFAFAIAMFLRRRRINRLVTHGVWALVGLSIPATAMLVYLANTDLLSRFPEIWRQIGRYSSHSIWEPFDLLKWAIVILIAGFPMMVRGVIFRQPRDRAANSAARIVLPFAILWLIAEIGGVIAQARMYPYHFLVLTPPAALLFALIPRTDRLFPLLSALALPLMLSCYGVWLVTEEARMPRERMNLSDYLASRAAPGDVVWRDELPRLLIETDLSPGSRYVATFIWANDEEAPQEYCSALLDDFQERRPTFLILPTDVERHVGKVTTHLKELRLSPRRTANYIRAWSDLKKYVVERYTPLAQIDGETLYRRSKPAPESTQAARTE